MRNNTTRDAIIELGRSYMQTIGYHSFTYKQIAIELGIKNSSIHHYFPFKEDLALAVIEKDKHDFKFMVESIKAESPTARAEALLNNYTQYFKDGQKLCVISTFGTSFNDISKNIQRSASEYIALVIKWLTDIFKEGLESNEFSFKDSPEDMTAIWVSALPGSLSVGRMHGVDYFDQIISRLKKSLKEA
ncbi:TetR/AcrR family transcriptional regulator [Mucilaginibacter sp. E4BP6]|uniref:TetR/AcrR family transcriptional regulator n=1 Tax=Mucilaginibacter sp. E4BP6 TaxID=2723089 RepID=UPI0015CBF9E6|nr:TetR/AcrR family transcriptional regulator [Mucilaginibacter sp. E4BP6]NYE64942.1 TetR/AcrR family transcriptional repressor of nem operon [Mucilaginibacter sp. E4BP6]